MDNLPDRLSGLPLSIVHEILARVPIRDAIGTCVLSKQWRYTWATLPHLDMDSIEEDASIETIENFVSNVLLHHKGPIHRFEISINVSIDSIEKWMLYLSRKDIRELSIRVDRDESGDRFVVKNLKSSIYACVNLTKLSLACFTFDSPPTSFNGFLALTDLELVDIELSPDELESLVACCPVLETLKMIGCPFSEVRIRSLNLKNLVLIGQRGGLCLYAPLLAKMQLAGCFFSTKTQTVVCNYTNFLGCFTNLVELIGDSRFLKYLSVGIDSCLHTLVLHRLTAIELTSFDLADTRQQSVVARLIFGAPNLHKLQITGELSESDSPYVSIEDFGCEPNFTLEKLREVSLDGVCDHLFGMRLMKLLLERSPVLETVNLDWISRKAADEVLGFRRCSTHAMIRLKNLQ